MGFLTRSVASVALVISSLRSGGCCVKRWGWRDLKRGRGFSSSRSSLSGRKGGEHELAPACDAAGERAWMVVIVARIAWFRRGRAEQWMTREGEGRTRARGRWAVQKSVV